MLNEVLMFISAGSTCTAIHYAMKSGRVRNSLDAYDRYCLDLSNQLAAVKRENHAMRATLDAQQEQRRAAAKRAGEVNRQRAEMRRLKRVRATARAMVQTALRPRDEVVADIRSSREAKKSDGAAVSPSKGG